MASLNSGNLSFDFQYTGFKGIWIEYEFYFRWKGEPVIRDKVLKRNNDYWDARSKHAFLAREDEKDGLLPLIWRRPAKAGWKRGRSSRQEI